ncbi:MAG: hypothetical protein F9K25_07740 [Candidatus Contendobacter sp.]|nr:MAG: hypothetical protein F9K25_07740 [Candidatus Contendobacter sp.]
MRLIYLDQSILSAMFGGGDELTPEFRNLSQTLCFKLVLLKARHRVNVIVSDIHSRETAAIPDEHGEKRVRIWNAMNQFADGRIADPWIDVFVAQQRRRLTDTGQSNAFPLSDIGIPDRDTEARSSAMVISTNEWRLRLHKMDANDRNAINAHLRGIYIRQKESVAMVSHPEATVSVIRNAWKKELTLAIAAFRFHQKKHQKMLYDQMLSDGFSYPPPDIIDHPFKGVVKLLVRDGDEELALTRLEEQIEREEFCAALELRISLEAQMLLKTKGGKHIRDLKRFNREYGLSMQNDIDYVSAFVPYCDVITVDKGMGTLCEGEIAKSALSKYPCTIMLNNNLAQLDAWLDSLDSEVVE